MIEEPSLRSESQPPQRVERGYPEPQDTLTVNRCEPGMGPVCVRELDGVIEQPIVVGKLGTHERHAAVEMPEGAVRRLERDALDAARRRQGAKAKAGSVGMATDLAEALDKHGLQGRPSFHGFARRS